MFRMIFKVIVVGVPISVATVSVCWWAFKKYTESEMKAGSGQDFIFDIASKNFSTSPVEEEESTPFAETKPEEVTE